MHAPIGAEKSRAWLRHHIALQCSPGCLRAGFDSVKGKSESGINGLLPASGSPPFIPFRLPSVALDRARPFGTQNACRRFAGFKNCMSNFKSNKTDGSESLFGEVIFQLHPRPSNRRSRAYRCYIHCRGGRFQLRVGKAGFVAIQNLSAGQRCVAVFPLLLRNTKAPLVIDQPEDNLDNRHIADVIAPDLLTRKVKQQFLVTSHNANLVVLADADLVIHVDSDGARCSFPQTGFLACATSKVKQSVLDVLDGGEAALAARQRKYAGRK